MANEHLYTVVAINIQRDEWHLIPSFSLSDLTQNQLCSPCDRYQNNKTLNSLNNCTSYIITKSVHNHFSEVSVCIIWCYKIKCLYLLYVHDPVFIYMYLPCHGFNLCCCLYDIDIQFFNFDTFIFHHSNCK